MRSPLARWREHLLGAPGRRSGPRPAIGPITRLRVGFALAPSRTAVGKASGAEKFPFETLGSRVAAVRFMLLFAVVCQISALMGCAYCASPHDYCGPTFNGGCDDCLADERYGSILSGPMLYPTAASEFLPGSYEELGPYEVPQGDQYAPPGEELPEPAPLEELLPEPRLEDLIPNMPADLNPPLDLEPPSGLPPPGLEPPSGLPPPLGESRRPRSIRLRR